MRKLFEKFGEYKRIRHCVHDFCKVLYDITCYVISIFITIFFAILTPFENKVTL